MLRSRQRNIVFSQIDHSLMTGEISRHAGNARFSAPPLPAASFVTGVTLHDFGFGVLDRFAIGEMSEEERARTFRQGIDLELSDPIADAVKNQHILRLMQGSGFEELAAHARRRLLGLYRITATDESCFEQADRWTRLCDSLGFAFGFELPTEGIVPLPLAEAPKELVDVHWVLDAHGRFRVSPWPFSSTLVSGIIVAYEADSYPSSPSTVPWTIEPFT